MQESHIGALQKRPQAVREQDGDHIEHLFK